MNHHTISCFRCQNPQATFFVLAKIISLPSNPSFLPPFVQLLYTTRLVCSGLPGLQPSCVYTNGETPSPYPRGASRQFSSPLPLPCEELTSRSPCENLRVCKFRASKKVSLGKKSTRMRIFVLFKKKNF